MASTAALSSSRCFSSLSKNTIKKNNVPSMLSIPTHTHIRLRRNFASSSSSSLWSHLSAAPLDGNHAAAAAYEKDSSPLKVNLTRGVYKDDKGKDWTLPSVSQAEALMATRKMGHEYLPFNGLAAFTKAAASFAFGDTNPLLKEDDNKVASVQTISGTGALRVGAEFLQRFRPSSSPPVVYLPAPSYVNHTPIFQNTAFQLRQYRYYHNQTNSLDFAGMKEDIAAAPAHSVVLLHACAHNPTGIDPNHNQWKELSHLIKEKKLIVFFDSAYQGFASGDPVLDAFSFRHFAEQGHQILMAQSFAKNFGLYGQRVGALHVCTSSAAETKVVMSVLNQVIRPMYSNPPLHGARIVSTVFNTPELHQQWLKDVKTMADRINGSRRALVENLQKLGSKKDWSHITNQIGMFAFSGLSSEQVIALKDLHVHLNSDGRMSMSGVNSGNVQYLAEAIHKVTQ